MDAAAATGRGGVLGKGPALWKANVLVFTCLFLMVMFLFLFQLEQTKRLFMEGTRNYAMLLAKVARLHVQNAFESQKIMDKILEGHLKNIASFIGYLNGVAPFSPQELESFSRRTGLYGLAILHEEGEIITGVKEWQSEVPYGCRKSEALLRDPGAALIVLTSRLPHGEGCVVVALPSRDFDRLQAKIGLESAVNALKLVPGVISVTLHDSPPTPRVSQSESPMEPLVIFDEDSLPASVSITLPLNNRILQVRLDASLYATSVKRLWQNFMTIAALILISGGLLSYWLYLRQKRDMAKAVQMEQVMSRQREEAMIGRAAATIAHEVRNPLNAVHMALQRLKLESSTLDNDAKRLIEISLNSIRQANTIISDLLEFSRPIVPKKEVVDLKALLEEVAYFLGLDQKGIRFKVHCPQDAVVVQADPGLMRQVVLNLFKNGVEAQPNGGFLEVWLERTSDGVLMRIMNGGEIPAPGEDARLLEPYFTTKSKGTGIGLPFSKRIIGAHGGDLTVSIGEGTFEVIISIPA